VLRDRAEARSKVGKSIAERSGEPSVQSVQSVPMPGEEEEDLINLGVAAWRRRGHAVQWRRGAACHQSGGAACHQPPRPPLVAARPGRPPADSGTGLFTVCTVVIVGVCRTPRAASLPGLGWIPTTLALALARLAPGLLPMCGGIQTGLRTILSTIGKLKQDRVRDYFTPRVSLDLCNHA
jgi:hypothetical protein